MDGLSEAQILRKSRRVKRPDWIGYHDHIHGIPGTKSFVSYPYDINETYEKDLNAEYNPHGYTVILRPRSDSEYNTVVEPKLKGTYKVLILEPDYDQEKIDHGCCLLRKMFHLRLRSPYA
ncbi:MAG: hypothetical protein J4F28_06855 [Nitrosopumilaceae archaeon]|nr:hypothetical protein [Nitrosopumilaceae archaeon]